MKYDFDHVPDRRGTYSFKWDTRAKEFPDNPDVIPMWVADTDFPCPEEIASGIMERARHPIYAYSTLNPESSQFVADWQKRRNQWEIDPLWVSYSAGVVPAINRAVHAFTERNEGVIIQPPVYYPFKNTVVGSGRVLLENNLLYNGERWVIDYEGLEKLASREDAKLLIFCNPHNPVGRVYTEEELRKVGNICLKHGITIFSDEIHSDLIFQNDRHIPIASLSNAIRDITITAMAPSKTFNIAGLQISTLIISNDTLKKRLDCVDSEFFIPNLFAAVALDKAYSSPGCEEYVEELMAYLWENYLLLDDGLRTQAPEIKCQKPEGTYLLWLDCRNLALNETELWKFFVVKAGVGIELGSAFGKSGKGFVRMNIGCTKATIQECVNRIAKAYQEIR